MFLELDADQVYRFSAALKGQRTWHRLLLKKVKRTSVDEEGQEALLFSSLLCAKLFKDHGEVRREVELLFGEWMDEC